MNDTPQFVMHDFKDIEEVPPWLSAYYAEDGTLMVLAENMNWLEARRLSDRRVVERYAISNEESVWLIDFHQVDPDEAEEECIIPEDREEWMQAAW